ncbi:MAG: hypothetical protein C4516_08750 [Oxalobacter sp.]|nr:MAG: hypothetical protein C4516_08750 [Oxalobacter sp.]
MGLKTYKVNELGIEAIKEFLLKNHKRPTEATTESALADWAAEAESYADANDMALIILTEEDSVSGEAMGLHLEEPYIDTQNLDEAFI